jgi:hypothetical protein
MSCRRYDLGDEITIWVCRGDMEMRWAMSMCDGQQAEYELESDLECEEELAQKHAQGELDCPWPWYADDPTIEMEPQVFIGVLTSS